MNPRGASLLARWLCGVALLTAGCDRGSSSGSDHASGPVASVRDSAGIEIVATPGAMGRTPAGWLVEAEPGLQIGVVSGAPESQFSQVRGAARLSSGEIAVVDQGTTDIRVFGPDGSYRRTVGGRGSGPGELQAALLVARGGADSLLIYDGRIRRFTWFSMTDGGHAVVAGVQPTSGTVIAASGAGALTQGSSTPSMTPGPQRLPVEFRLLDLSSGEERLLVRSDGRPYHVSFDLGDTPYVLPVPFSVQPSGTAGASGYYFTEGAAPEILLFDTSGALRRILRLEEEPRPIPRVTLDHEIDSISARMGALAAQGRQVYRSMQVIPHLPWFDALRVDDVGWLWARLPFQATPEGWPEWMVFSPDGLARGTVALPPELEVQEIGEDYILGVAVDDLRVQYVRMYRLQRR